MERECAEVVFVPVEFWVTNENGSFKRGLVGTSVLVCEAKDDVVHVNAVKHDGLDGTFRC